MKVPDAGCSIPQLFKDTGSVPIFALSSAVLGSLEDLSSAWLKVVIDMSRFQGVRRRASMEAVGLLCRGLGPAVGLPAGSLSRPSTPNSKLGWEVRPGPVRRSGEWVWAHL